LQAGGGSIRAAQIDRGLLDSISNDLSAVIGLWNESVVRGPAWHFGEIGRRLERVFGVIDGVRGALALSTIDPASMHQEYDAQRLIEIVLATNESLVAYRRRYRSDGSIDFGRHQHAHRSDDRKCRSRLYVESDRNDQRARGWRASDGYCDDRQGHQLRQGLDAHVAGTNVEGRAIDGADGSSGACARLCDNGSTDPRWSRSGDRRVSQFKSFFYYRGGRE